MAAGLHRLPLEKPIYEIEDRIAALEAAPLGGQQQESRRLKRELVEVQKKVFGTLDPWQTVLVSRHPNRPKTSDYLDLVFDEFVELHGDKSFGDDPAMLSGFAKLDQYKVMVIGHQKGRDTKERGLRNFGMSRPEGYRKALRLMKLAEKFGLPVFTFVDTPGAYPGIGAEERGQSEAIGRNIFEMAQLEVPIIVTIIGEGGSGGALAISVGDQVLMLQFSVYSVISPEGCASILWKTSERASDAAEALGITAHRLKALGMIDKVVSEPVGGAHRDTRQMASQLKRALVDALRQVSDLQPKDLLNRRYDRLQAYGRFADTKDR